MHNKVFLPSHRYMRLRTASATLFIIALIFVGLMIFVGVLNGRNFNGEVAQLSGEVTFVDEDKDGYFLIELDGKTRYTASPIRSMYDDWQSLLGKQVTLTLPQKQVNSTYRWIIGVQVGDNVIVDYRETLQNRRVLNRNALIALGVFLGALIVSSGAVYAWQKNTSPTVERDLAPSYCDFTADRQPCCPLYRKLPIISFGYAMLVSVLCLIDTLIRAYVPNNRVVIAVAVVAVIICAAATVLLLLTTYLWLPQKEREFYAENYPFDFNDISHVAMRKKFKEQLQKELTAEAEAYPHRYGEGGNSLLCDFTEKGVTLSLETNPDEKPSADEVFGEGGEDMVHLCDLTYEELNFEAVPHYRKKDRPLFIVVKSRLQPTERLENLGIYNDIHIVLDSNLLATLRHFGVQVENLDYLLENKAQLMKENCKFGRKVKKEE